ncbi:MAG: endonuclease MutS2 [Candidatus Kapabacteria bacterium]|nr:endonuclease MutS2 [Candidatus Kapabacteria bacterium]
MNYEVKSDTEINESNVEIKKDSDLLEDNQPFYDFDNTLKNLSASEDSLTNQTLKQLEFHSILEKISKYCFSELGKELILSSYPTDNLTWLQKEFELIQEMVTLLTEDDPMPSEGMNDIRSKLNKARVQNACLTSEEVLKIYDMLKLSRLIKSFFEQRKEKYPVLYLESELLFVNKLLEKHINDAIDVTGEIKDTASRELFRIRTEIREKSNRLRNRLQRILKRVSEDKLIQEDFFTIREGRFVLPIKAENKRQIPGIIHGVSQTGATVFLEPTEIIEMNNDISLLQNEEKREVYRILSNLTAEIGQNYRELWVSTSIISHIDSINAKAKYSLDFGGIKPTLHNSDEIELTNIRHPLLVHSKGLKNVVPLNITFSKNKRGHLISGPNAGGKTVALKSIGLNLLMTFSGIFPIGYCSTGYRRIFSSIGDNQSIENDLSTFSSQMLQIKQILDNCSSDSLVLIDEIGSGTDPQEGSALAAGILESFLEMKSYFVVTTHQSSLKSYALRKEEIDNDSMEFDVENMKPTYKFLQGVPGNSYAFIMAKNIGLSNLILERAKNFIGDRHSEIEESISILQKYKSETETLRNSLAQENLRIETLRKDLENQLKEIKQKKQKLINEGRLEANELLQKANSLIENTIREIREEKKALSDIKKDFHQNKAQLDSEIKQFTEKYEFQSKIEDKINIGDNVYYEDPSSVGSVIEISEDSKTALVDFQGVKFRLPLNKLYKALFQPTKSKQVSDLKFASSSTIDLRGKRAEESIREVDQLISDALISNMPYITIIHGKGTGALREAIHEFLKTHPSVSSFRLGKLEEGGAGVTIVEF